MSLTFGFGLGEIGTNYTSNQFSDAMRQITGDGVCIAGGKLALSASGFTANLSTGYVLTAGRWVENDEPLLLTIPPSGNYEDRFDGLVMTIDEETKKASIEILEGVDGSSPPDGTLYLLRVRRGATSLSDANVTDLRKYILPMSELTDNSLQIYHFLTEGVDREVKRLLDLIQSEVDRADNETHRLDERIHRLGGAPYIGDLMTSRRHPPPENEWLICDGGAVPTVYPKLSNILNGVLPNIPLIENLYGTYIYGGVPEEVVP